MYTFIHSKWKSMKICVIMKNSECDNLFNLIFMYFGKTYLKYVYRILRLVQWRTRQHTYRYMIRACSRIAGYRLRAFLHIR